MKEGIELTRLGVMVYIFCLAGVIILGYQLGVYIEKKRGTEVERKKYNLLRTVTKDRISDLEKDVDTLVRGSAVEVIALLQKYKHKAEVEKLTWLGDYSREEEENTKKPYPPGMKFIKEGGRLFD